MTDTKNTNAPEMATFEAICAEIKAERNRPPKRKAAEAYSVIFEEHRETLRAFYAGNATEEERNASKAREVAALEALKREQDANATRTLRAEILTENAQQAFATQYLGKICEIWNRYEGKPHGEKTADKIRAELASLTGQRVSIGNKYSRANITVYPARGVPLGTIEIGAKGGSDARATDDNNRIISLDPDALTVYYCGEYVHDIGAHIKALKKAHAEAVKAAEKAREAFAKYNDLTRGNMNRANLHDGHAPHRIAKG